MTVTNAKRPYYGTITTIDTGVFKGVCYVANRTDTKRFLFRKFVPFTNPEGVLVSKGRNYPAFAVTDAEFNVLKWVGPHAEESEAKYSA